MSALIHELRNSLCALRLSLELAARHQPSQRLDHALRSLDRVEKLVERGKEPPNGRNKSAMRPRGLTLLEVLVSLALFGSVALGVLTVYTGLLAGTRKAESNSQAVAALDTLADLWEQRLKENWPTDPPPDPVARLSGTFMQYPYEVEDQGRIALPGSPGTYLEARRVRLQLTYLEQGQSHQLELTTLVAR